MKNAKMYLNKEMSEFLINEFAANNVEYLAIPDAEQIGEDSLTLIQYDNRDPFIGNYIFTAGVAITNELYRKAGRRVAADNILNSVFKKDE
jgi:hypothetical protein